MSRLATILLLVTLVLPIQARAEQVYVRNRPFKGAVTGSGDDLCVGLEAMAGELGVKVTAVNGGWVVTTGAGPDPTAGEPNKVTVAGKSLDSQTGPSGEVMVNLKALGQALGCRVTPNKGLGTIDVSAPQGAVAGASKASAGSQADPTAPANLVRVNRGGAAMELSTVLLPGKINMVVFEARWCPYCKDMPPALEACAKENPGLGVIIVDVGASDTTPIINQYRLAGVPSFLIFDGSGKQTASGVNASTMAHKWLGKYHLATFGGK